MADNTVHPPTVFQAAKACATNVSIGVILIVAASVGLGAAIEHKDAVVATIAASWSLLLWLFSFGGNFWGGVVLSAAALSVATWASCVIAKCPDDCGKMIASVLAISTIAWLLADLAVFATFTNSANLDAYQKVALLAINGPFIGAVLLICFLIAAANPEDPLAQLPLLVGAMAIVGAIYALFV